MVCLIINELGIKTNGRFFILTMNIEQALKCSSIIIIKHCIHFITNML